MLNHDKKSFSSEIDKKTISSGFSDSYFFPEGVIKYPSFSASLDRIDMLPDLSGERLVEFNFKEK